MDAEVPSVSPQASPGPATGGSVLAIALAQLNPTVGDVAGNLALMSAAARRAHARGARIVAFPQLALTGHYPGDLLGEPRFRALVVEWGYRELLAASLETPGLAWVVGLIGRAHV